MNVCAAREIILVQPPFVQLNSPYPAPYYLKSFLEKRGFAVRVRDHSIGLFEKIFCKAGLKTLFDAALEKWESGNLRGLNGEHMKIIERFLSEKNLWLSAIDRLVNFLRGRDNEWGHFLALASGGTPGGPRFDAAVSRLSGEVSADSAKLLASKLLSDLADFITVVLDPGFSLIRYTAASGAGIGDFGEAEKSLDGFIMKKFYLPFLEEEWKNVKPDAPFLLGLTIPFPGCLPGALTCAASAKEKFDKDVLTVCGGGYVNTELRFTKNKNFSKYFDRVSLDRSYGFLASLLAEDFGGVRADDAGADSTNADSAAAEETKKIDDEAAAAVFPDYGEVDFSRYLCPVDDANPMHRLWSDGRWLKAYLAHGCYWHSCAFCDVTLDYIKNYFPVNPDDFFSHFRAQAEKTGIRGIHLVDEAAPVSSLVRLAALNRASGLPLNFWGNIRFERGFTPDVAALLAAGGLLGVSAGIEIASESGLKRLGKGTTLADICAACAGFKEAGILVHAYLIFGYWDEDEQEIIDSAEIVRQFFSEGLLDSCFWHKFILTRHSRIYAEKQRGLHRNLKITGDEKETERFALNDLSFEGENKFNKYSEPIDRLVSLWMSGDIQTPVSAVFPFKVKEPRLPPDYVSRLLDKYARERDAARSRVPDPGGAESGGASGRVVFLGTIPLQKGPRLFWRWRLIDHGLKTAAVSAAQKTAALLESVSCDTGKKAAEFYLELREILGDAAAQSAWKKLRQSGLAVFHVERK